MSHAQRLIVEIQHTAYNLGAQEKNTTVAFIESLGWIMDVPMSTCADRSCDVDADYSFVNKHRLLFDGCTISTGTECTGSSQEDPMEAPAESLTIEFDIKTLVEECKMFVSLLSGEKYWNNMTLVDDDTFAAVLNPKLQYHAGDNPEVVLDSFLLTNNVAMRKTSRDLLLHAFHMNILKIHVPYVVAFPKV